MKCQDYRELFTLILTDSPDEARSKEVEDHLAACKECRAEYETTKKLWNLLGELPQPQPSYSMKAGFNGILSNYKEELIASRNPVSVWMERLIEHWHVQLQPRLIYSIFFVVVGMFIGYLLHRPGENVISYNRQIDSLSSQVSEMKQLMMLSLLQNPSASQRIQAVSYTEEINNADLIIIDALFTTLNEDPNVNVRLATLEALVKWSDVPDVREGLVRSISLQESPLMQSAIADVMVKIQEKRSVPSLQKLLTKKDLNQMVKVNIQKSINKLI